MKFVEFLTGQGSGHKTWHTIWERKCSNGKGPSNGKIAMEIIRTFRKICSTGYFDYKRLYKDFVFFNWRINKNNDDYEDKKVVPINELSLSMKCRFCCWWWRWWYCCFSSSSTYFAGACWQWLDCGGQEKKIVSPWGNIDSCIEHHTPTSGLVTLVSTINLFGENWILSSVTLQ